MRLSIIDNMNLIVNECNLNISNIDYEVENSYILNYVLAPIVYHLTPQSLIHKMVCDSISNLIAKLQRRFAM